MEILPQDFKAQFMERIEPKTLPVVVHPITSEGEKQKTEQGPKFAGIDPAQEEEKIENVEKVPVSSETKTDLKKDRRKKS